MIKGNLHPTTSYLRELVTIFDRLGFDVFEGPEVDSEWYNFDSLNVPADSPIRDIQDTFWLKDGRVMRTQTSNAQVRYAEKRKPPIRMIAPGRCFRNEATDSRHETTFTQLEGLYIDKDVKIGHLFWTLNKFIHEIYGDDIEIRYRPHHYAFVEPGFDIDIKFQGKWFEVLGSGMVHPKVLANMKIDPNKHSGFAFGLGIERLVMIKYDIDDIRHFCSGNLKFLKQF